MRARRTARRIGRVAAAVAVVGTGVALHAGPASAAYSSTVNGTTLAVTITSADSVTITCVSGQTRVNGSNVGLACATATSISVNGSGGPDTIDATAVTSANFPALTTGVFYGNGGGDTITGGGWASNTGPFLYLSGGDGDDHLVATVGKATLDGGPGDDTLDGGAYFTTIAGGPGRDTIDGGSGSSNIHTPLEDLPDQSISGGGGGIDSIDIREADRVWMKGKSPGGCSIVASSPTRVEAIDLPASIDTCAVESLSGETSEAVIAGLSPNTSLEVVSQYEDLALDLYTGGATTHDPVGKTYTRSGFQPVRYAEYFGGTVTTTLHETYGTDTQRWVHSAARDLTDTQLSDGDLSTIAAPIAAGNRTKASYTKELTDSTAWRGLQVDRIFQTFLHRLPDPSGRNYWIGRIGGGTKVRVVRAGFMASPEYYEDSGGTATAYVTQVYRDVLGRDPEPGGLSYWVNRLNSGDPRSAVATALIVSAETEQKEVVRQYRYYLGRDPLTAVRDSWVPKIRDISDGEQQLHGYLVATAEYEGRAS